MGERKKKNQESSDSLRNALKKNHITRNWGEKSLKNGRQARVRNLQIQECKWLILYLLPNMRQLGLDCVPEVTLVTVSVGFTAALFAQSMLHMVMTVSRKTRSQIFRVIGHLS